MSMTLSELLDAARREITEVSPDEAFGRLAEAGAVLVDVREDEEWVQGHVPGARHVSRGVLEMQIDRAAPDSAAEVILYCASGNRSLLAARTLRQLGYTNVRSMAGGMNAWVRAGHPVEKERAFTVEQLERYSRHISLPQVGREGQAKLLGAKVLLIGAGGLGSPAALYLAAAGVGTLGIIDSDVVDRSNLQRQILHDDLRVGRSKAESARETLQRLNPDIQLQAYAERLDRSNARQLIDAYDIVVDGCDNLATRYLANDAAYAARKPVVHGSIFQFDGQVTIYHPHGGGPCYRCIFPEVVDDAPCLSCTDAGVLGVLPGVIGVIQATETIKLILGLGETLVGRLLLYNALQMRFREFKIEKDPECPLCGDPTRVPSAARP